MSSVLDALDRAVAWGQQHATVLVLAGLGITVLLLAYTVRRAIRSGYPDRWLARLSFLVGFAWSGEAMWEVATQKLLLSHLFAGFAFFLFESQMATAMMRAEKYQQRFGHPGRHGRAVWLIAVVAGIIAAMAGDSAVEVGLRLAVPLLVAHQWWVALTGDGEKRPADAITWTWTPRRILVAVRLARPGEHDLATVDRERHIRTIAAVSHRLHSTSWRWRRAWCQARLRRLAMTADDDMLDAARLRVERVWQAADRTRPIDAAGRTLIATAQADADAARADLDQVRATLDATQRRADAEAAKRGDADADAAIARQQAQTATALAASTQGQARHAAEDAQRRLDSVDAEVKDLRSRLALAEARRVGRPRRATAATDEPLTFDGTPLPEVTGVGPSTVLAVLQARRDNPADSQRKLARRVQVSDRTVRTVLTAIADRELVGAAP
jgi:hypothetical protein